tara:strand:- start:1418 stop:2398 length:981 start_codon:yes stop_codon:yes gene_type:complete
LILKRYIPIAIVAIFGTLTLSAWFIDNETIETFANDDATQFFDIIAAFAVFLGALNLLKLQFIKFIKKQKGWQYSAISILSFFAAFIVGFFVRGAYFVDDKVYFTQNAALESLIEENESNLPGKSYQVQENSFESAKDAKNFIIQKNLVTPVDWGAHVQKDGSLFQWMFKYIFSPLSATMFALLAFFVASASFRAFRARNFEASLLLLAGIIIMIGRVPAGGLISSWMIMYLLILIIGLYIHYLKKNNKITIYSTLAGLFLVSVAGMYTGWPVDKPSIFYLPLLQEWIYLVPNAAGSTAILMGIGLGIVVTSLRYIFGLEKSYLGE